MKFSLLFVIGLLPFIACTQSDKANTKRLAKAKSDFNLISNKDFETLDCSKTVTGKKMKQFFKVYPELNDQVKVISIPNCYGNPGENYFVLLHERNGDFRIPKYVHGSVKPTASANE